MAINLISYLIISLGCSLLWSKSEIFSYARNFVAKYFPIFFRKMLLCMECSSFWVGCFVSLFFFPYPYSEQLNLFLNTVCGGISTFTIVKIIIETKFLDKDLI
jgi:hypothetical protein